ncbi:MAG: TIGR04348 family glycosyltransferase [Pseudonocardiales bacterium]|nr:TIGR04348 family glycosyltransferase [Pseudonocardiales bacterium]MBV9032062.1 TIGR04348 family glycosyltransferase [Pseudonocardiales bacterium]MBW0008827.1 TIGR04348 family glycosyltransferase [Pseudonocardiales bacterium]
MRICLVTPAPAHSRHGNRVTALRWAKILRGLGHRVEVAQTYGGRPADLLIALHAGKSAGSLRRFRARYPHAPVVLALTGTDLYPDLVSTGVAVDVLDLADRLVVLQPLGMDQLPASLRERARVIYQSAGAPPPVPAPAVDVFEAAVIAHLRPVKDPLLAAAAVRLLPADSTVRVRHAGAALDRRLGEHAARESRTNPRYSWVGELSHLEARRLLGGCRLLVLTSRHEGGANVLSEALAAGVPTLASRIPGSVGILGAGYPGYFPVADAGALAELMLGAERNTDGFYDELRRRCAALRSLVDPDGEQQAWTRLLAELNLTPPSKR